MKAERGREWDVETFIFQHNDGTSTLISVFTPTQKFFR